MNVEIKPIPQREMRYPSLGDYFRTADGALYIKVQSFLDERYEFLIAVHELIEETLTRHRGIKEEVIKAFDEAHLDSDDPGSLPDAPYYNEHVFAECIERLVAREMGVNWDEYAAACEKAIDANE